MENQNTGSIICPTCSAPNEADYVFCNTCGTNLSNMSAAPPPPSVGYQQHYGNSIGISKPYIYEKKSLFDKLFNDAGRKLKKLARVLFIIQIVLGVLFSFAFSILVFIFFMEEVFYTGYYYTYRDEFAGVKSFFIAAFAFLFSVVFNIISAYISTFLLHAFGELCENIHISRKKLEIIARSHGDKQN